DGVSRRFDVEPREPAVFAETEARDRIVAAVGREQKLPIRREDDAARAFKSVWRALLTADRLEGPGTGAAGGDTFHLGQRALCIPMIVADGIADFVGLRVERSTAIIGPPRLCSSDVRASGGNGSPSHRARCHLQKRSTMYALRALRGHLFPVLGHTCLLSIRLDYLVSPSGQLRTRVCMADFEKVIQLTHDRVTSLDAILSVLQDCERA